MKLSDRMKAFRADRPDEWQMDEFIRMAEELESDCYTHQYSDYGVMRRCSIALDKRDSVGMLLLLTLTGSI